MYIVEHIVRERCLPNLVQVRQKTPCYLEVGEGNKQFGSGFDLAVQSFESFSVRQSPSGTTNFLQSSPFRVYIALHCVGRRATVAIITVAFSNKCHNIIHITDLARPSWDVKFYQTIISKGSSSFCGRLGSHRAKDVDVVDIGNYQARLMVGNGNSIKAFLLKISMNI